jgi:hypothetical protein
MRALRSEDHLHRSLEEILMAEAGIPAPTTNRQLPVRNRSPTLSHSQPGSQNPKAWGNRDIRNLAVSHSANGSSQSGSGGPSSTHTSRGSSPGFPSQKARLDRRINAVVGAQFKQFAKNIDQHDQKDYENRKLRDTDQDDVVTSQGELISITDSTTRGATSLPGPSNLTGGKARRQQDIKETYKATRVVDGVRATTGRKEVTVHGGHGKAKPRRRTSKAAKLDATELDTPLRTYAPTVKGSPTKEENREDEEEEEEWLIQL